MKHIIYHTETEREALEYTSKIVDFGVALIVYAALNQVRDAVYSLQRSSLYRQAVRRRANNALALANMKITELKSIVADKQFAETYWDTIVDAGEKDVANFREEIKKILDAEEIEHSDVYSYVETTRVMLEAAKIQYEEDIKDCQGKFMKKDLRIMSDLNLFDIFKEFYVANVLKAWEHVCNELYRDKTKDIELTNDRTTAAFDVLAEKFAKGLYIDECLGEAKKVNPSYLSAEVKTRE